MLRNMLTQGEELTQATSNELVLDMDLRYDALNWMGSIIDSCKNVYQCKFYAKQYQKIYKTITDAN